MTRRSSTDILQSSTKVKRRRRSDSKQLLIESKNAVLASVYDKKRTIGFWRDTNVPVIRSESFFSPHDTHGTYSEFSNMYPHGLKIAPTVHREGAVKMATSRHGQIFTLPTPEHWYQFYKMSHAGHVSACEFIINEPNPVKVKAACGPRGQRQWKMSKTKKTSWDSGARDVVMMRVVREKMKQNPRIKAMLMETPLDTVLVENTTDPYWGVGRGGSGRNMLGETLMALRREFHEKALKEGKENVYEQPTVTECAL